MLLKMDKSWLKIGFRPSGCRRKVTGLGPSGYRRRLGDGGSPLRLQAQG